MSRPNSLGAFLSIATLFLSNCSRPSYREVDQFPLHNAPSPGLYHTLDGVYAELNEFRRRHPQQIQLFSLGESAVDKRDIPVVRLSFSDRGPSRAFLFVAATHGDEAVGTEALLYVIRNLLSDRRKRDLTRLERSVQCYFVPVHNPDGFSQNLRENGHHIDINRNFPFAREGVSMEPETGALVALMNTVRFEASLFFHSANEEKYDNLVRVPVELGGGHFGPVENTVLPLWQLVTIVEQAGNRADPGVPWHHAQDVVGAEGIASDWAYGQLAGGSVSPLLQQPCHFPHPSLTIELCFPKQPMAREVLNKEEREARDIILDIITKFAG